MRAAVMTEFNAPLRVEEVTPAPVGPRQALVRIAASGLCHSDLLFWQGYAPVEPPIVLGHEGAGVVEEVGTEVQRRGAGRSRRLHVDDGLRRVLVLPCAASRGCARSSPTSAASAGVARGDGSAAVPMLGLGTFADHAVLDERSLVKVQTDLPDEQLALIGCGVTTGVGAALNTAAVCPGSSVAVIGCGGVGQSVIQGARIAGATRIIAVDPAAAQAQDGAERSAPPTSSTRAQATRSRRSARSRRARRRLRLRGHRPARRR